MVLSVMRKLIIATWILFLVLVGTVSHAAEVVLQWDASIDAPYLLRYSVYKTETKGSYVLVSENSTVNNLVGNVAADVLTLTVTIPDPPYRCWFVVTCTDTREIESDKSNEVCYNTMPAPGAPINLRGDPYTCAGDFDYDGDVDGTDLAVFTANFGRTDCGIENKTVCPLKPELKLKP